MLSPDVICFFDKLPEFQSGKVSTWRQQLSAVEDD